MAAQIHLRGWFDTRANIEAAFGVDPLIKQLKTKNMTMYFTKRHNSVEDNIKMAILITYASYQMAKGAVPAIEHIHAVSVGELIAPVLPDTHFLAEAMANEAVKECLIYYLDNETLMNKSKAKANFLAMYNNLTGAQRAENWDAIPVTATSEAIIRKWGEEFAEYLLTESSSDQKMSAIDLFTTMFVAVAKRGNVSDELVNKITRVLADDLQHTSRLNSETIRLVYKFYGRYVNATNAREVLKRCLDGIPTTALRVRLTLEQTVNTGLTAYIIVGRAITKYPDFPWARLNSLTGGELTNYMNAVVAVNGNEYYGFNKSLGAAKQTGYSSIAYVAKELLIQLNGESSLKRYVGWLQAPKSVSVVKALIENYKTGYLITMESGEISAVDAQLSKSVSVVKAPKENNKTGYITTMESGEISALDAQLFEQIYGTISSAKNVNMFI